MASVPKNIRNSISRGPLPSPIGHPRTVGWFGTTAVAMGGINQSLFLPGALFVGQGSIPGQGSAAIPLLAVGLLLSWAATPGWTELVLMCPNRVGGIAATCVEAFQRGSGWFRKSLEADCSKSEGVGGVFPRTVSSVGRINGVGDCT
jgi:hypothetical protein